MKSLILLLVAAVLVIQESKCETESLDLLAQNQDQDRSLDQNLDQNLDQDQDQNLDQGQDAAGEEFLRSLNNQPVDRRAIPVPWKYISFHDYMAQNAQEYVHPDLLVACNKKNYHLIPHHATMTHCPHGAIGPHQGSGGVMWLGVVPFNYGHQTNLAFGSILQEPGQHLGEATLYFEYYGARWTKCFYWVTV